MNPNTFPALGLDVTFADTLKDLGITIPTKIQAEAIPVLLQSTQDFIGLAQTGTGKTAAFGLPLLQLIDKERRVCQGVVLAPTRELAQQIAQNLKTFAQAKPQIKIEAVYGGAAITHQIKALKAKPQIIVATPGRLVDMIQRKVVGLDQLAYVILDEADEMLNMGFKEELNTILDATPEDKTTWLFSATMPQAIHKMVNRYMHEPKEISVKSGIEVNQNITHEYVLLRMNDKQEAIRRFVDSTPDFYGILFCRTKADAQKVAEDLSRASYHAEALHGDLTQKQRDVVMRKFKAKAVTLLVATDVAARGIDVNEVTHVIHHRLPDELEFYTHRSGRTARAGKTGISLVLATKGDTKRLTEIERQLNIEFKKQRVPTTEQVMAARVDSVLTQIATYPTSDALPEDLKAKGYRVFENLTKEDMIDKLLSSEWGKVHRSATGDINLQEGKQSQTQRKKNPAASKAFQTFAINIGKMDKIANGELLRMLCDIAGVKKSAIGKIDIQKQKSYFEVSHEHAGDMEHQVKGYEFEGRPLRIYASKNVTSKDRKSGRPYRKKQD